MGIKIAQSDISILDDDTESKPPLITAASEGNIDEVRRLIEQGTDVNMKNSGGATALMVASSKGNTEVVKLLLEDRGSTLEEYKILKELDRDLANQLFNTIYK